ncbi:TPA: polysaccharide pyruvyl transferase family protein, partial [Klebsiella pneumoniae]|nr:polysaccharide pyruvyl transferase family protein [Klebsiella pneumoniae]
ESKEGNFGDDLNRWLWDSIFPGFFDSDENIRFSGIGTIINTSMPKAKKWIVFSSGIGYGYPPESFGSDCWDIASVRGPLSAKVLKLGKDKFITDGAALLATLPEFSAVPENERSGVIFIPHHKALETGKWLDVCKKANVEFVDPRLDAKYVINKIRHSKLVLADAMHAAIIADSMRVPWVPLRTSKEINTFKWMDWTNTINIEYKPINLGVSTFKEWIRSSTLCLYGEQYYVPSLNENACIKHFERNRNLKQKKWWRNYVRIIRLSCYKIPVKVLCLLEKVNINFDYFFFKNAVKNLKQASKQNGLLSDDTVFYGNVGRLKDNVEMIKHQYSAK